MKIRIKGNSVRYRLTRPEVEIFCEKGYLEEITEFPSGNFKYTLQAKTDIDQLHADIIGNVITLFFPDSEKDNWFHSDLVGYRNSIPAKDGSNLILLLEKDFVCLDHTEEDQTHNYPNPNTVC